MPIREGACRSAKCSVRGARQEHFYHSSGDPLNGGSLNPCNYCGGPTDLVEISRTHVVFTGVITERYKDRSKENGFGDGHHVWRRRSAKDPNKPERLFIETWEDQKRYCADEGLANPREMSNNYEVGEDGKTVKNSMGLPGCEV